MKYLTSSSFKKLFLSRFTYSVHLCTSCWCRQTDANIVVDNYVYIYISLKCLNIHNIRAHTWQEKDECPSKLSPEIFHNFSNKMEKYGTWKCKRYCASYIHDLTLVVLCSDPVACFLSLHYSIYSGIYERMSHSQKLFS